MSTRSARLRPPVETDRPRTREGSYDGGCGKPRPNESWEACRTVRRLRPVASNCSSTQRFQIYRNHIVAVLDPGEDPLRPAVALGHQGVDPRPPVGERRRAVSDEPAAPLELDFRLADQAIEPRARGIQDRIQTSWP